LDVGGGRPLLVVVSGPPASGKTTLARKLAAELRLPLLEKDAVKERLADVLGSSGGREWSQRLSAATMAVILDLAAELVAAGVSVVAEANFARGLHDGRLSALSPARLVEVHCEAPLEVLRERLEGRDSARHPIHYDAEFAARDLDRRLTDDVHGPLRVGELIRVDTTGPTDVGYIAARVRRGG
jgi:predicted kinase